jgi:hypothetical protein
MLEEQPLLLGALGIAAGALLGAALPPSEQEDRSFGRLRDETLDRAKTLGARGMRRAREKAEEITEQGREALAGNGNGHAHSSGSRDGRGARSTAPTERTGSYASERSDVPGADRSTGMSTSSGSGPSSSAAEWPNPAAPDSNQDLRVDTPRTPKS